MRPSPRGFFSLAVSALHRVLSAHLCLSLPACSRMGSRLCALRSAVTGQRPCEWWRSASWSCLTSLVREARERSLCVRRYPWQPFERLAAEAVLEDMGVVDGHAGADVSATLVSSTGDY